MNINPFNISNKNIIYLRIFSIIAFFIWIIFEIICSYKIIFIDFFHPCKEQISIFYFPILILFLYSFFFIDYIPEKKIIPK